MPASCCNVLLDKILLSNISSCEIADAIHGNYAYIFNRTKEILKDFGNSWENRCETFKLMTELTLKEIKYLQTPDLLVDLISSSRWSRMTSLMYSYQARISVNSPNLPSRTFTLQGRNVNIPDFQHIDNFKHFCLNTSCCIWNFSLDLKASEGSAPATPVGITLVFVKDLSILNFLG